MTKYIFYCHSIHEYFVSIAAPVKLASDEQMGLQFFYSAKMKGGGAFNAPNKGPEGSPTFKGQILIVHQNTLDTDEQPNGHIIIKE